MKRFSRMSPRPVLLGVMIVLGILFSSVAWIATQQHTIIIEGISWRLGYIILLLGLLPAFLFVFFILATVVQKRGKLLGSSRTAVLGLLLFIIAFLALGTNIRDLSIDLVQGTKPLDGTCKLKIQKVMVHRGSYIKTSVVIIDDKKVAHTFVMSHKQFNQTIALPEGYVFTEPSTYAFAEQYECRSSRVAVEYLEHTGAITSIAALYESNESAAPNTSIELPGGSNKLIQPYQNYSSGPKDVTKEQN